MMGHGALGLQIIIKRQRATIEKLKVDNAMLKREISAYGKDAAIFTELTKQHMNHAQDEADKHSRSIELERRRLEELEKQLALATSRVRRQPLPASLDALFLM